MKQGILAIPILMFFTLLTTACNPHMSGMNYANHIGAGDPDQLPPTFEGRPRLPPPTVKVDETEPADAPRRIQKASSIIANAQKVMDTEGRSLGTACNRYVQRVLNVSGFPKGHFLANDFDLYAKKFIRSYQVENFTRNESGSEQERLKKHLWSFPERTPFIMQWSRAGVYGHIAIVERIGENLVIYQASLNRYTARKDQTTINTLLNGYNRRVLSVYSGLTR